MGVCLCFLNWTVKCRQFILAQFVQFTFRYVTYLKVNWTNCAYVGISQSNYMDTFTKINEKKTPQNFVWKKTVFRFR